MNIRRLLPLLALPLCLHAPAEEKPSPAKDQTATESTATPTQIAGKIYNGKRLLPKVEILFAPDVDPVIPGKKASAKKKTEITTLYEVMQAQYKKYVAAASEYDQLSAAYESAKTETTTKFRFRNGTDDVKPLAEQLKILANKYKPQIAAAKIDAQAAADGFKTRFQAFVNRAKTVGKAVGAASDGNGSYKAVIPQAGTYYIILVEPEACDNNKYAYLLRSEYVAGDNTELNLDFSKATFEFAKEFVK